MINLKAELYDKGGIFPFLSLFRVATGLVVIYSLLERAWHIKAHYLSGGVLPESSYRSIYADTGFDFTLFSIWGSDTAVYLFFILGLMLAATYTIGYRVKLSALLLYIVIFSIEYRFLPGRGDDLVLMKLLVFWSFFLPVNTGLSIRPDAKKERNLTDQTRLSVFMMHLAFIYLAAFISKEGAVWRESSVAIEAIYSNVFLQTPLSEWLLNFPRLLRLFTKTALIIEFFGGVLILLGIFMKSLSKYAFYILFILHVAIFVTIRVSIFPIVSTIALLPLLDSRSFAELINQFNKSTSGSVKPTLHTNRGLKMIKSATPIIATTTFVFVTILQLVHIANRNNDYLESNASRLVVSIGLDQSWRVFAPSIEYGTKWPVVVAEVGGAEVDLWRYYWTGGSEEAVDYDFPDQSMLLNSNWELYIDLISRRRASYHEQNFVKYLCSNWNDANDRSVGRASINIYERSPDLSKEEWRRDIDYYEKTVPVSSVSYYCLPKN